MRDLQTVKCGNVERKSFARGQEIQPIPYLVEVQKDSYNAFIEEGIGEVFEDFSPITDFADHYELYFLDHNLDGAPKYTEKECRDRDATFAVPLEVKVRLNNKITGEIIDQNVFMGDLPKMTNSGSFIINGAERVVVSQLVRSPGVYNAYEQDKSGKKLYKTTIMPNRGAWLEFEQDSQGLLSVRVDKNRKITATTLLRALGFGSDDSLLDLFEGSEIIANTVKKDRDNNIVSEHQGLFELYKKLRPGEVPTEEAVKQYIRRTLFFDARRYDLAKVGRYKYNKRLCLANRIIGLTAYEDIISLDGEVLATKGEVISEEKAREIQNSGINSIYVLTEKGEKHKIIANNVADFKVLTGVRAKSFGLIDTVHYPTLVFAKEIYELSKTKAIEDIAEEYITQINDLYYVEELSAERLAEEKPEDKKNYEARKETRRRFVEACAKFYEIIESGNIPNKLSAEDRKTIRPLIDKLNHKHITVDDIVAGISLNIDLIKNIGTTDDIDHLGNRRVRSVGELLQNQFRIGMSRLEKVIKERMSTQDPKEINPKGLINVRLIISAIKEFFGSSQLSQFMDQTNPIAELTHKRKLSALGPGGLNRERATFDVRDVHYTHYGRMCPIETPEGQNIGLITSLSSFAKVNEYGFIESAYRKVDKKTGAVTDIVEYLTADVEDRYTIAQANEPLDEKNCFVNERVLSRRRDEIVEVPRDEVDYMDVSSKQLVSVATALIPFLENSDTNRALMGSNMQRQAVPLLVPENAIVGTGIEAKIAYDSGVMVIAENDGVVKAVSGREIIVDEDGNLHTYTLKKFERSNQSTCLNQRPIVNVGDIVKKGDILADGPATANGELALGRNILIGYMTWEGYNYEDAILLSEKLVQDDVFTSIHIEEYELEERDTKLGSEEITRDIPHLSEDVLKDLDEDGIIRIGAEVTSGDILVGKVSPKGEVELTPEERLLRAIFGDKAREVKDTSLKVPHGESGIVVDVKVFSRENKDDLAPGVNKVVRVYVAQKRKISVGDKMAGRYGNKGVISRILPESDMPFLADGTPLQIVLNPLGVPSRMNIGQVLEVHLGLVCKQLGWKVCTPVFEGATEKDIRELLEENNIVNPNGEVDGKIQLYDGRTGEPFENRVTVGSMYMIKLHHLVDDKIHARSIGPYSLVTQQPLGGKAQFGGQRFGEMEVWALEAYGAAHILQEMLTVKSDDIVGRLKTYDSIVSGNDISEPGIPESFKVLFKELQACALDMRVLTENNEEISLKDLTEESEEFGGYDKADKEPQEEVELDFGQDEDILDGDDMFDDDLDDFDDDSDFSSGEMFDDYDDLDDLGDIDDEE